MIEVKVKDAALREAAMQDMDAFLGVFINATKEAIGGELNAENMQQLSVAQITLLAYDILHEEVMDGGFVQLIYNGYGGFIFDNPFAKVLRDWGLRDLAKMLFAVRKLYKEYGDARPGEELRGQVYLAQGVKVELSYHHSGNHHESD